MKIEEELAGAYLQNHREEIFDEIRKAFLEGYRNGVNKPASVNIDGVTFYDLGLPSGTMWSEPVTVKHQYQYVSYELESYNSVCGLELPTWDDFQELKNNCMVLTDGNIVSKDVVIVGPNGKRLCIGTHDYLHGSCTHCHRCGENVPEGKNRLWLKSETIDNYADVIEVEYSTRCLNACNAKVKHFVGLKLPYVLVKRPKNQ